VKKTRIFSLQVLHFIRNSLTVFREIFNFISNPAELVKLVAKNNVMSQFNTVVIDGLHFEHNKNMPM